MSGDANAALDIPVTSGMLDGASGWRYSDPKARAAAFEQHHALVCARDGVSTGSPLDRFASSVGCSGMQPVSSGMDDLVIDLYAILISGVDGRVNESNCWVGCLRQDDTQLRDKIDMRKARLF